MYNYCPFNLVVTLTLNKKKRIFYFFGAIGGKDEVKWYYIAMKRDSLLLLKNSLGF
jgi:hypothetical protein